MMRWSEISRHLFGQEECWDALELTYFLHSECQCVAGKVQEIVIHAFSERSNID
jgi:hypothetical protein